MRIDEFSGENVEPVSAKIAVTKFKITFTPTRNDSNSTTNAMRIAFFASRVTEKESMDS